VSGVRYDLERVSDGRLAIRMPISAAKGVGADAARAIVLERLRRPYADLEDLWRRVPLEASAFRALARAGALDALLDGDGRRALWHVGVLERRLGAPGVVATPTLFTQRAVGDLDVPALPPLSPTERLSWDLEITGTARAHPMTLIRRTLASLEVRPVETCFRLGETAPLRSYGPRPIVTVGGVVTLRQRPPTANGVLFLTLEDETGFIQCVVRPAVQEHLDHHLRRHALVVRGELHATGGWRGLVVTDAWPLDGAFGGYDGQLSYNGGRDRRALAPDPVAAEAIRSAL
jgi:error-prone DNA polymerase